nr:MATE family efflux transporter [uncultured Blautia sp.]
MKEDRQNLTTGSIWGKMLFFSIPLVLTNLLQVLFNMADIAVIGRFAGSLSLGAVGSTTTLVTLFTGILIGMAGGINVLVARFFGAKDKRSTVQIIHTAFLVSLAAGVIVLVLGMAFSKWILELLNTKAELLDGAVLYIRIYFLGMPALALYNFGNAVCSAFGDTKKPLYYLAVAGVVNVVLNLFFVIVCKMDVAGVATASIISQYISAFLILRALVKMGGDYALRLSELKFDKRMAKYIIEIGLPAGLQNGIFQVANLFIQAGVNSFDAIMVAGNSAAANADALLYDSMAAFYTACGSFMGQNYGAGKRDRVRNSYLISLAYSFGIGLVGGILLVIFGKQFLGLFTNDSAVVEAGMKRLTIMGYSYGFSAFMDSAIAASRALGKSIVPTIIVIMGSCVFRMIWVNTIFAYFKTIPSLYLLFIFSWGITATVEIIYFVHVYKNTKIG